MRNDYREITGNKNKFFKELKKFGCYGTIIVTGSIDDRFEYEIDGVPVWGCCLRERLFYDEKRNRFTEVQYLKRYDTGRYEEVKRSDLTLRPPPVTKTGWYWTYMPLKMF